MIWRESLYSRRSCSRGRTVSSVFWACEMERADGGCWTAFAVRRLVLTARLLTHHAARWRSVHAHARLLSVPGHEASELRTAHERGGGGDGRCAAVAKRTRGERHARHRSHRRHGRHRGMRERRRRRSGRRELRHGGEVGLLGGLLCSLLSGGLSGKHRLLLLISSLLHERARMSTSPLQTI